MAGVDFDPAGVAGAGAEVAAAGATPSGLGGAIGQMAGNPVTAGVEETLFTRTNNIARLTAEGAKSAQDWGAMLHASAGEYVAQEAVNRGGLTLGAAAPALVSTAPAPAIPPTPMAPAVTPAPVVGPLPGDAKVIAAWFKDADPAGWHTRAQQLRQLQTASYMAADQLRGAANTIDATWRSEAGSAAAARVRGLATWYDGHGGQIGAVVAGHKTAADNLCRAKAAIPGPEQLEEVDRRIEYVRGVINNYPELAPSAAPALAQLQAQKADLQGRVHTGANRYFAATETANLAGEPLAPPPQPRMGHDEEGEKKKHDGHHDPRYGVQRVDNQVGGQPELPHQDPPFGQWDGPPPPGWHTGTGYWAVDTDHPYDGPQPRPTPAPYQSSPPCVRRDLLTGPPTGVTSVGGGSDNPQRAKAQGFDLQGTSRIRVVGSQFNGITQMVQINGHWYQAQWQEYQYQMNTIPVVQGLGQLGGITFTDMSKANVWRPVSLGQIVQATSVYPEATFYLPDLHGGTIKIQDGEFLGGYGDGPPRPPVMTSAG